MIVVARVMRPMSEWHCLPNTINRHGTPLVILLLTESSIFQSRQAHIASRIVLAFGPTG